MIPLPPPNPGLGRIAVGMSGGVDSSMAALLLHRAGYDVQGITLRLWPEDSERLAEDYVESARRFCASLGVPHAEVFLEEEFARCIVAPFVEAYAAGETPSPCVRCNRLIKFGAMLRVAGELGCARLATGHYARRSRMVSGRYAVRRGVDEGKDQSYFLFELTQDQLAHAVFPLAGWRKEQVREQARTLGIRSSKAPESQDLCFVPDGDHVRLVAERYPGAARSGDIVDREGRVLGQHQGICRYTVGQRQGLGLGGGPWYVVRVAPDTNRVVVGRREELATRRVIVRDLNWQALAGPPQSATGLRVQLRYRMRPAPVICMDPLPGNRLAVHLAEPVYGAAPGQAAVWYTGDAVAGGGWIAARSEP